MFPLSLLLCLCAAKAVVEGSTCTKRGNSSCICTEEGTGIVDLTQLANTNTKGPPRFKDVVGASSSATYYYYNPCFSFTELASKAESKQVCTPKYDVAVCQIQDTVAYLAGKESSAVFSGSAKTGDLKITYSATTDTKRISVVRLVCKENLSLSESAWTYVNQKQVSATTTTYNFDLTSRCCCPNLCQHAPSSGGLSVGSILLIVFFSLIFVYIIGGLLYLKFVRGASGVELIPNYSFWSVLPGLIKEGVVFLIGKCRGQDTSSSQYDKI